jgi:hypothetical protein
MKRSPKAQPKGPPKAFRLKVTPDREHLNKAIEANGVCDPKKCWHRMGVYDQMEQLEPGANHHIHVDAGHTQLHFQGWHYIADMPRHVKLSMLLFDAKQFDKVRVRSYVLNFRRVRKVIKVPRERQDQINAARRERIAAGGDEYRRGYPNLRKRVVGFSSIV